MSFGGLILTNAGRNEIAAVVSNEHTLKFTHVQLGDGIYNGSYLSKSELVNKVMEIPITRVTREGNEITIDCDWNSSQSPRDFYFREIGIIGNDVLCYYDNAGTGDAEYIDPKSATISKEKRLRFVLVISEEVNVTIHTASNLYASAAELEELDKKKINQDDISEWAKQPSKPSYTKDEVGLGNCDNTSDQDKPVSKAQQEALRQHGTDQKAHDDIRQLVSGLTSRLNALVDTDDTTLDQLSEIVSYIKSNRGLIDSVTTSKVSVSDIIDNLTSTATNKPLSAKQGKVLNDLITALTGKVDDKVNRSGDVMTGSLTAERTVEALNKSAGCDVALFANDTGSVGLFSHSLPRWLFRFTARPDEDYRAFFDSHRVFFKKGSLVDLQAGTPGTRGFIKIVQLKILRQYADYPTIFEISGRTWTFSHKLCVAFHNDAGTDPDLKSFIIDKKTPYKVAIIKSSTSTWDIYMEKSESYGACHICSMFCTMNAGDEGIQITFPNEQISNLPSGYIEPTVITWDSADTANKLATPRSIGLGGDLVGSADFDGSKNITINAHEKCSRCVVYNTNNYPYHRFAYTNKPWSSNFIDYGSVFMIVKGHDDGGVGIFQVRIRTNASGIISSLSIHWLIRGYLIPEECIRAGFNNTSGNTTVDLFYVSESGYDCAVIYRMNNTARTDVIIDDNAEYKLLMCDSTEVTNTTTSDKKTSIESYATMSEAASILGKTFVRIVTTGDRGIANQAKGIIDSGDRRGLLFSYSKDGLESTDWLAAWNGNELRAMSPSKLPIKQLREYANRPTSANRAPASGVRLGTIEHFLASASMTEGKPSADGHVLQMNWDNSGGWDVQIALTNGNANGVLQHRGMSNGVWGPWKTTLDSSNYESYAAKYEEGEWTPILGGGLSSYQVCIDFGEYTRIGDIIVARCRVTPGGTAYNGTVPISQSSLPFPFAGSRFVYALLHNDYNGGLRTGCCAGAINSIDFSSISLEPASGGTNNPNNVYYATIVYKI